MGFLPPTGYAQNQPDAGDVAQLTPAVQARKRRDVKRGTERKIGSQVLQGQAPQPATPPPTGAAPPPPAQVQPAPPNSTADAVPQYQAPQYQAPHYEPPKKGLEYLALGLGLLFPGAPIAKAAAGFAQGLTQGAEQRYQRSEQEAQQQYKVASDQAQAQFQNAQLQYQAAQQMRAQGIDPKTGKAFELPPNLTTPLSPHASAQDYMRREAAVAQFYAGVGATDVAKQHMAIAQDYQKQAIDDANNARAMALALFNQQEQDKRETMREQAAEVRQERTEAAAAARQAASEGAMFAREEMRFAHEDARAAVTDANRMGALRDEALKANQSFYAAWSKATLTRKDASGNPISPVVSNQQMAQALGKIFSSIDRASDPADAAQHYEDTIQHVLGNMDASSSAVIKELLSERGRAADLARRSHGLPIMPNNFGPVQKPASPAGGGAAAGPHRTGRSASAPGKPTLYEYSDGTWKP